jgi:hypothetical protein
MQGVILFLVDKGTGNFVKCIDGFFGATTIDNSACDIFEAQLRDAIKEGFSTLLAVRAGQTRGVSTEHLAKIWRISHDDAAWMLEVTTQLLHTNDGSSLSCNAGTDDRAVQYKKLLVNLL